MFNENEQNSIKNLCDAYRQFSEHLSNYEKESEFSVRFSIERLVKAQKETGVIMRNFDWLKNTYIVFKGSEEQFQRILNDED